MRSTKSSSSAPRNHHSRVRRATRIALGATALAGLLATTSACNSKPNTALCGRYYRHSLAIQERDGQPGALAGLKTEGAKRAMLGHCMELDRSQVECVLDAADTVTATVCERNGGVLHPDRAYANDAEDEANEGLPVLEGSADEPAADYGYDPASP